MKHAKSANSVRATIPLTLLLLAAQAVPAEAVPAETPVHSALPYVVLQPGIFSREAAGASEAVQAGDRLLISGDFAGAGRLYARAAQANKAEPVYRIMQGVALASAGRSAEALAALQQARKPEGRDVLTELLIQGLQENQQRQGAKPSSGSAAVPNKISPAAASESLKRLQKARQRHPNSPVLLLLEGDILQLQQQWPSAVAAYQQAITRAPDWIKPRINLGVCLMAQGQTQAAISTLDAALTLDPKNVQAQLARADARLQAGQTGQAIAEYRALQNSANASIAAQAYSSTGQVHLRRGENSLAIKDLKRAQALSPSDPVPPAVLGQAQENAGNYKAAAAAYGNALKLSVSRRDAAQNRGALLQALAESQVAAQNYSGALQTLTRAVKEEPQMRPVWYRLWAQMLLQTGKAEEAKGKLWLSLEMAQSGYPQETMALLQSQKMLGGAGKRYNAQLAAAKNASGRARALRSLAHLARYQNDTAREVRLRTEVVKQEASGANWFTLAEARERAGDRAGASQAYRKALQTGGLTTEMLQTARTRTSAK